MILDLSGKDWPAAQLQPDLLELTSRRVRAAYTELIEALGRDRLGDIDWWVTSMASRNTYACPLYQRLCQLAMVRELGENGPLPTEVITDSRALANIFEQILGPAVRVRVTGNHSRGSRLARFMRHYAASCYHALSQYLGSLLWLDRAVLPANGVLLVDIFIGMDNLGSDGVMDRYYPGMLQALEAAEREQLVYTPIHYKVRNYRQYFKALNRRRRQLLLKEDVLKLSDYCYALWHPLRFRWPSRQLDFQGVDVGMLVREALWATFSNSSSVEALLRYRFARRLRRLGFMPGRIIEWFENQEVDHGAVAGWREFYPELEVVGYQGFLASPHYLCAAPTQQEARFNMLPTRLVVVGENLLDRVREFAPQLRVSVGPAFRFATVWEDMPERGVTADFSVLVALPIHTGESRSIIDVVATALGNYSATRSLTILVKPHPTWSAIDLANFFRGVTLPHQLLTSGFDEALEHSDLVVTAASSVCAYAMARGVPCVILGRPGRLLQNPVPDTADDRLWKACYTDAELSAAFAFYSTLRASERAQMQTASRCYRQDQFMPVTRERVLEFVGLDA